MANKIPLAIADFETSLSVAISAGATSLTLSSATDDDGNALPAGKYCFTVNNGSSNKQYLLGQLNGTAVTSVVNVSRQGVETSGAAFAARAGSPIIISDFATIQRVADILRGQIDLDGSSPIGYDAEPTLADRKDLATVGYVLDTASGGTVNFDSMTVAGNAGEAIVAGNLVYFNTADQEWYKTDADTAATVDNVQLGIALGTGSDGVAITGGIQIAGTWTTSALTAGSLYYASNTAGAIGSSAGTTSRIIGLALSTTKLLLIPRNPQDIKDTQKDALSGGGALGTPSSTNKFVTEDKMENAATLSQTRTMAVGTTTKNLADSNGATTVIAHGLGTTPTYVSLRGEYGNQSLSFGEWYTGGYTSAYTHNILEGGSTPQPDNIELSTSWVLKIASDWADTDWQTATVAVDATNITLTWTRNVTPSGTANILWLAKKENIIYS